MLFIFSTTISLKRKIAYIGLMFLVVSLLLVSMVNFDSQEQIEFLRWIVIMVVAGISLLSVVALEGSTRTAYGKWGSFLPAILISILPVVASIFLYLISIFLSFEEFGEKFIIMNSGWILGINVPLILIVYFLLGDKNSQRQTMII